MTLNSAVQVEGWRCRAYLWHSSENTLQRSQEATGVWIDSVPFQLRERLHLHDLRSRDRFAVSGRSKQACTVHQKSRSRGGRGILHFNASSAIYGASKE